MATQELTTNKPKFSGSPESAFIYRADVPNEGVVDLLGILIERARTITGVLRENHQGSDDPVTGLVHILDGTLSQIDTMIYQEIYPFYCENTPSPSDRRK